jgi:hypothetical protein
MSSRVLSLFKDIMMKRRSNVVRRSSVVMRSDVVRRRRM